MAAQHGYQDHKYYNSNGSYRIVYTAGSAAPRYDEQPVAPARQPQRQPSAPAQKPPKKNSQKKHSQKKSSQRAQKNSRKNSRNARRSYSGRTAAPAGQTKAGRTGTRQNAHTRSRAAGTAPADVRTSRAKAARVKAQAAPAKTPANAPVWKESADKPLTAEQVNAKRRREHIAQSNRQRESYMNRSLATFLIGMAAVVCGCCGMYVHMTAEVQETESRISTLYTQIDELRAKNDAYESELYSGLDLETIRTQAEELGMDTLEDAKIRYFILDDADYPAAITLAE